MTMILFILTTVVLRTRPSKQRAKQMMWIFLACIPLLTISWASTPADLGFLPRALVTEPAWVDFTASMFFFGAAFFGGVLQLYNLADRGFSLRILIDLSENPAAGAGIERMMAGYSAGQGISWMYRKRLDDLLAGGFVVRSGDSIALTQKGGGFARLFSQLRGFLRLA